MRRRSDASGDLSNEDSMFALCAYDAALTDCNGNGSPDVCEGLICTMPTVSTIGAFAIGACMFAGVVVVMRRRSALA